MNKCIRCSALAEFGYKTCKVCKEKNRIKIKKFREINKNLSLCGQCSSPLTDDPTLCSQCRIKKRNSNNVRTQLHRDLNKCLTCNRSVKGTDKKSCEVCLNKGIKRNQQYKKIVMEHYGKGRCVCCEESIISFLTINHKNNNGSEHRKKISGREDGSGGGSETYKWLIKNNFPDGFDVQCNNCNSGSFYNGGVCPHSGVHSNPTSKQFKLRKEVIKYYGNECACCGESNTLFLTMDHIGGNGVIDREEMKKAGHTSVYSWIKAKKYPSGFQVLCFNCNQSKGKKKYCWHVKDNIFLSLIEYNKQ